MITRRLRSHVEVELLGGPADGTRVKLPLREDGLPSPGIRFTLRGCDASHGPDEPCSLPRLMRYRREVSDRPDVTWVYRHVPTDPEDTDDD